MYNLYCITLIDNALSRYTFKRCSDSAKKFGYNVKLFPGISRENSAEFLFKRGIKICSIDNRDLFATLGCFSSHFLLWEKCLETNEPLIVLEDDAFFVNSIPDEIFSDTIDVCNLGRPSSCPSRFMREHMSAIRTPLGLHRLKYGCLRGAHAYFLKPTGAEKLVEMATKIGLQPADQFINSFCINSLQEFTPWPLDMDACYSVIGPNNKFIRRITLKFTLMFSESFRRLKQ